MDDGDAVSFSSRRRASFEGTPVSRTSTIAKNPPSGASTRTRGDVGQRVRTSARRAAYSSRMRPTHVLRPGQRRGRGVLNERRRPRLDCCSTRNIAWMIGAGAAQ